MPLLWFGLHYIVVARRYGIFSLTFLEKVLSAVVVIWVLPALGVPALKYFMLHMASMVIGTALFHL